MTTRLHLRLTDATDTGVLIREKRVESIARREFVDEKTPPGIASVVRDRILPKRVPEGRRERRGGLDPWWVMWWWGGRRVNFGENVSSESPGTGQIESAVL